MFEIFGNEPLKQWQKNRKLIVDDLNVGDQVRFSNKLCGPHHLFTKVYEETTPITAERNVAGSTYQSNKLSSAANVQNKFAEALPFALGQVWKVTYLDADGVEINENAYNYNLSVEEGGGDFYIGDSVLRAMPFCIFGNGVVRVTSAVIDTAAYLKITCISGSITEVVGETQVKFVDIPNILLTREMMGLADDWTSLTMPIEVYAERHPLVSIAGTEYISDKVTDAGYIGYSHNISEFRIGQKWRICALDADKNEIAGASYESVVQENEDGLYVGDYSYENVPMWVRNDGITNRDRTWATEIGVQYIKITGISGTFADVDDWEPVHKVIPVAVEHKPAGWIYSENARYSKVLDTGDLEYVMNEMGVAQAMVQPSPISIAVGTKYDVVWNGKTYSDLTGCMFELSAEEQAVGIGASLQELTSGTSEYPFGIFTLMGTMVIVTHDAGTNSCIINMAEETPCTLNPKWIGSGGSGGGGGRCVLTFTFDEDAEFWPINEPYTMAELVQRYKAGEDIVIRYPVGFEEGIVTCAGYMTTYAQSIGCYMTLSDSKTGGNILQQVFQFGVSDDATNPFNVNAMLGVVEAGGMLVCAPMG